jgi:hypothetical protein
MNAWIYAWLIYLGWFLNQCGPPVRGFDRDSDEDGGGAAEGIREERETDQTEGR